MQSDTHHVTPVSLVPQQSDTHRRSLLLQYDAQQLDEQTGITPAEIVTRTNQTGWLNLIGDFHESSLRAFGRALHLSDPIMRGLIALGHRPQLLSDTHTVAISLRTFNWDSAEQQLIGSQTTLYATQTAVLSLQETSPDYFFAIAKRLRNPESRLRSRSADTLLYTLLDTLLKQQAATLSALDEEVELLEEEILHLPAAEQVSAIQQLKQALLVIRQSIWPLRDLLSTLSEDSPWQSNSQTTSLWQHLQADVSYLLDLIELQRHAVGGLLDLYLSSVNQRANDIVRVLTVIATIFMPLTFITSLYGMNFQRMPELAAPWGYPIVLLLLVATAGGLIFYFHHRRWL